MISALILSAALSQSPQEPSLEDAWRSMVKADGLTSKQAAARAVETSRDVEAKQAARDATEANLHAAQFGFIPKVTASAAYTRVSEITPPALGLGDEGRFVVVKGPPGPVGDRQLFAAPDFTFPVFLDNGLLRAGIAIPVSDYFLRTLHQVTAASHSLEAADLDARASKLKASADARITYYQWIRGRSQQVVAAQALSLATGRADDVKHAFEAGGVSRADVLRAESLVESTRLLMTRAESAASISEEALRIAMRTEPGQPLAIGEDVFTAPEAVSDVSDIEKLVHEAASRRLELKSVSQAKEALDSQRATAWAGMLPRLDATASAVYANPNQRYIPNDGKWHFTWDVGAAITWTPTDIPSAHAQLVGADARVRQTEAQRAALEDALRLEVRQAWLALRESDAALSSTQKGLSSAEEGYRVRQDLFRNGRATTVEVIDAANELTRARFESVNARIDARVARVRLEHATGRDIAEVN